MFFFFFLTYVYNLLSQSMSVVVNDLPDTNPWIDKGVLLNPIANLLVICILIRYVH